MVENIFPFVPKSTARLERGHFWAIPLSDNSYGAGCVIGNHVSNGKPSRRMFLAGVIAWHGDQSPISEDLANCEIFECAFAHIKCITKSNGEVLGKASLNFGNLPADAEALTFHTWGYGVPVVVAHEFAGVRRK